MQILRHLLVFLSLFLGTTGVAGAVRLDLGIPSLKIQTQLDPQLLTHGVIDTKDSYLRGTLLIDTDDMFADIDLERVKIRGRGHASFEQDKKSYKLKLAKKSQLLGLPMGKDWNLLANFQDGTLMASVLAMEMGQLLDLPFTPELIPVELSINNLYKGLYWLTPHRQVGKGRIDLGKQDILLELGPDDAPSIDPEDKAYYQFISQGFKLPVNVHYPRLHKQADKRPGHTEREFAAIQTDFNRLEQAVLAGDLTPESGNLLDRRSLAKFLLVNLFTANVNLNEPQSIFLYKQADGAYKFGPLWDFDTAFGGSATNEFFTLDSAKKMPLQADQPGAQFFKSLLKDPQLKELLLQEWLEFRQVGMPQLRQNMANYIDLLQASGAYRNDYKRWQRAQDAIKSSPRKSLREYQSDMNRWLDARLEAMDKYFLSARINGFSSNQQ